MGGEEDNVSCDQGDGITSLAVRVQIGQDRLSSCLNLMACVITWARLDSIAVVVPESVHYHRDAIPQRPKAPAYDLLYFLGYAQQPRSTFSVGTPESIAHHASQLLRWIISSTLQATHRLLCI